MNQAYFRGKTACADGFAGVLTMKTKKPQPPAPEPTPTPAPWTRPEKIAVIVATISAFASLGTVGTFLVNRANRQDTQAQTQQTQSEQQIDARIDKKLGPISDQLRGKVDDATVKKEFSDLREEMNKGFQTLYSEIAKTNDSIHQTQIDLAKLTSKVEGIDKNVDRLIGIQLKSAANLPPAALGPQIANVNALYEIAGERKVIIPDEINNQLRLKLASVITSQPDFWILASVVITRSFQAAVGPNFPTTGRRPSSVTFNNSTLSGVRLVLDTVHLNFVTCNHCIVEYYGGAIDVRNTFFSNCLFIVTVKAVPAAPGAEKTIRTLLASTDLELVTF
jgi:hypothetical protein